MPPDPDPSNSPTHGAGPESPLEPWGVSEPHGDPSQGGSVRSGAVSGHAGGEPLPQSRGDRRGSRPTLLDAYCGAGGAARGYQLAGFHVTGVDINPQPRYRGDDFVHSDAIKFITDHGSEFDAIHASPPCQAYTPLGALHPHIRYPDLVADTRAALEAVGGPWVIENVMTAPLLGGAVLCGGMFGLRTYRHRRFEPSVGLWIPEPAHPRHRVLTATRRRRERWAEGWNVSITGDVGVYVGPEAMGIDWMTGNELCEAIPPAYTAFVGGFLLAAVRERAA